MVALKLTISDFVETLVGVLLGCVVHFSSAVSPETAVFALLEGGDGGM